MKEVLVARGLDARRIHVIHNGSLPIPPLSPGERNSLAHELGIDPSRLVVGMIARLAEGNCSMEVSPYYASAISGLERVADHLVNVGFSIMNPIGSQKEEYNN